MTESTGFSEYRPATDATGDHLWLHTCGALEAYPDGDGPDSGYCGMCGEHNTWTPLYRRRRVRGAQQPDAHVVVMDSAPVVAEVAAREVEAAARALFEAPPSDRKWDELSVTAKPQWRCVAHAALVAAAWVRAESAAEVTA